MILVSITSRLYAQGSGYTETMNLLILGGTRFIGRHLTEAALGAGHTVTLFNRNRSATDAFPNLETLVGDRNSDVSALRGRTWDAVIDTSAYTPTAARLTAEALQDSVPHYTFISTVSVYGDFARQGVGETYPTGTLSDEAVQEAEASGSISADAYGPLKARCEQVVTEHFPDRALIVRPGLVVGPHDYTDRLTCFVRRIGRAGRDAPRVVLAPGAPTSRVQFIDARDLAHWLVEATERRLTGTFNATGPAEPLSMGVLFETIRTTLNPQAELVWVEDDVLLEQGLQAGELMPWHPAKAMPGWEGFYTIDASRAVQQGLTFRPLTETLRDIFAWDETRKDEPLRGGLSPEREAALLEARLR